MKSFIKYSSKKFSITTASNYNNIGVIGCGQMGTGISYVFNRTANKNVIIYDSNPKQLSNSLSFLNKLLDKEVTKNTLDNTQTQTILNRFKFTSELNELALNSNFIVEAAVEDFWVKSDIFKKLDSLVNTEQNTDKPKNSNNPTILATNTSSISITKLASVTSRPENVIGMHFMNPVPIMKLVEVIRGLVTSDSTFNTTSSLVVELDKELTLSQDIPGFIVNRILMPMINEACFVLYEGIASVEDIDKSMKLGTNVPMGPLTLADFIGLDTCLFIMNTLYDNLKDSKYRPCPLLVNYVNAGLLGRKSKRGFYKY